MFFLALICYWAIVFIHFMRVITAWNWNWFENLFDSCPSIFSLIYNAFIHSPVEDVTSSYSTTVCFMFWCSFPLLHAHQSSFKRFFSERNFHDLSEWKEDCFVFRSRQRNFEISSWKNVKFVLYRSLTFNFISMSLSVLMVVVVVVGFWFRKKVHQTSVQIPEINF